mgnify:CR=1 FL=1
MFKNFTHECPNWGCPVWLWENLIYGSTFIQCVTTNLFLHLLYTSFPNHSSSLRIKIVWYSYQSFEMFFHDNYHLCIVDHNIDLIHGVTPICIFSYWLSQSNEDEFDPVELLLRMRHTCWSMALWASQFYKMWNTMDHYDYLSTIIFWTNTYCTIKTRNVWQWHLNICYLVWAFELQIGLPHIRTMKF